MRQRTKERILGLIALVILLTLLLWAAQTEDTKASSAFTGYEPYSPVTVVYVERVVTVTEHHTLIVEVGPDCEEDEDWVTVHYETPNADLDSHGVTRQCVNAEEQFMNELYPYLMDGSLIWEWDLPDDI